MRVLVVDDDVVVSIALSMELADVALLEATRSHEGYDLAVRELPDAIVVDLRLPDGDGMDLVRRLRRNPRTSRTPMVVLTAGHDPGLEAWALRSGADAYLAKPCDGATLMANLRGVQAIPPAQRRQRRRDAAAALRRGIAPESVGLGLVGSRDGAHDAHGLRARWRRARGSA